MSQAEEYEIPEDDLDPEEGDPEGDTFDPEAERERIRQEMQEKFDADKARFEEAERRRISDQLRNEAGIEWDPQSGFRSVDPVKATQFAARGVQPSSVVDPLDAPIDFYADDAETMQAKMNRREERLIEKMMGEFDKRLSPLQNLAMQPALTGVPAVAKSVLEQHGMVGLADHPDFAATVTKAMQDAVKGGSIPAHAMSDPQAVGAVVGMLAFSGQLPKAEERPRERGNDGRFTAPNPSRAALAATRPSNGSGMPPRNAVQMDDEDKAIWETCESGGNAFSSQAEYEAFARSKREGDPSIYTDFRDKQRQKAAGRR